MANIMNLFFLERAGENNIFSVFLFHFRDAKLSRVSTELCSLNLCSFFGFYELHELCKWGF
jgi:hypothetical protein